MKPTVLIVDDELTIVESLQELLEYEGYGVVTAPNGRRALEELERARPSLVLTDYMMPQMNGLQLLEAVRASPSLRDLPVVVMSAVHGQPSRVAELGAQFLGKPFELEHLLRVLAGALQRLPPP
ncbi:response regulator [Aggregicoccus sp. 17bor-14]|uniref:response regulator n=1 Tax=Myxococcaceae TaxID=31 RepID=UPI00129CC341|nr:MULTISPECIES: response regulator [Myxococcaceae]MBF5043906.1 response regulator [Simulacricoccus sp. 17bor-14]MRI89657.1 response regulator [Aggregicoccus sp. 17bor-14]